MSSTAWLIELDDPIGNTLYFCADGDWCSNPNHAHKFRTAAEAETKRSAMRTRASRACEHQWVDKVGPL